MAQQLNNSVNPDDVINSKTVEYKTYGFDPNSGIKYRREEITSKAPASESGTVRYIGTHSAITESGAELRGEERVFFCYEDGKLVRWSDGFQCTRCRHLFYIAHLGWERDTGRTKIIQKNLQDGNTQRYQVREKIRYCKRCWRFVLAGRILSAPFRFLSYPLGHNNEINHTEVFDEENSNSNPRNER